MSKPGVNDAMSPPLLDRRWVHLALFVLTALSVFWTYLVTSSGAMAGPHLPGARWVFALLGQTDKVWESALFSGSVLLILGSHEMGHYLMARHHRVDATLPWFIPLPLLGFGTLGAVIRLRGRIPTRNALVDIGAGGPLAGLLVALPLAVAGMTLSRVEAVPQVPAPLLPPMSGLALARDVAEWLHPGTFGPPDLVLNVEVFGDNLFTVALQWLVKGPLPPGHEVFAHPLFIAAWFGLLVTMLNLLPVGQLDGGHVTHALFGRRAETLGRVVAWGLLGLALVASISWLAWFLVVSRVVRYHHPPVMAEEVPLSPSRVAVCVVCLVLMVVLFMPVPLGLL